MSTYKEEVGHIIGSAGKLIHHVANLLTITAIHLTKDGDADEQQEQGGEAFSQVERSGQPEPDDMREGNHWEPEWGDRTRIGFRSTK